MVDSRHLLLWMVSVFPNAALAATLDVSSPEVEAKKLSLDYRTGVDFADDENQETIDEYLHLDYGINDMLAVRVSGSGRKRGNADMEYNATKWDARFQLFENETADFDGAVRFSYQLADGDDKPDTASLAWLASHQVKEFTLTYNAILSHALGAESEDGLRGDFRWQALAPLPDTNMRLGLEGFHNVGYLNDIGAFRSQQHRLGLVLKGKLTDRTAFQLGYLQGISEAAPDHAMKLFLSWVF